MIENKVPNSAVEFALTAENGFSNQTVSITVKNTTLNSGLSNWVVIVIFSASVALFYMILYFISKLTNPRIKPENKRKSNKTSSETSADSKSIKIFKGDSLEGSS